MAFSLSKFLVFFTILCASSFIAVLSTDEASNLIQKTCENTQHYDLCVSSLELDSSSAKSDAKGLALIMINIAIANATETNSYIASQIKNITNNTAMDRAMRVCNDKYAFANNALRNSIVNLDNEEYDYAYMHVMAAGDYPSGCRSAFRRCPGLVYPTNMAVREEALKHICDVVLGIVDSLGS
ncbi:cell wall / vacuolar inhibitor of fructosidase 2 [Andrographis paniculata]|uniref:cell wall / vacuolar inhibitor of fructosidase 2 n=1 Tax=Andrographis paniculata TaxID=175694 RepID=UPI0021E88845|nr:cell wall / vacuolar inhibitor of fructosidase 2 [Andrographis paniculata]